MPQDVYDSNKPLGSIEPVLDVLVHCPLVASQLPLCEGMQGAHVNTWKPSSDHQAAKSPVGTYAPLLLSATGY